ncbi:hypothetical protein KDL28_38170 [Pseudonocardia sp. S2-4]|uniref:Uncharacterized protein n=1 Tax=Pseudonocardia humida TaxID=2800819 RepID=A0ABT1ADB3_9PSEU|nr:hypothetical protein [Pseudonocardia humida]
MATSAAVVIGTTGASSPNPSANDAVVAAPVAQPGQKFCRSAKTMNSHHHGFRTG